MKFPVYDSTGKSIVEELEPETSIYQIEPNDHVIYQAIRVELANLRQGTHSTKTKAEVRGGGKKPWRQKGRGTARAGSLRSPIWVGGGITFGPKPRKYKLSMPKKARKLARKSALSYQAKKGNVKLIEDIKFDTPKTKNMVEVLKALDIIDKKITFLSGEFDENLYLSGRNIPNFVMIPAERASTYDILDCEILLIDRTGYNKLTEQLKA